eukprot:CAMPEP_0170591100 /NCGR_PEP_ID=MMETSP0224-20130122/12222_1 /TAXON_ID=285029 /ORGANISM="Togula jolla, Strain CCCM 725" /LENGTH=725 /DNA_ID=CAMNT_0010914939 /DNA_START=113 /DNA_END=2290 /DNA_ORIENTATION=+
MAATPSPCRMRGSLGGPAPRFRCARASVASTSRGSAPDLVALPPDQIRGDPLYGATLRRAFGAKMYYGQVKGIDADVRTGERAYHISYEDGDEEHLGQQEVMRCLIRSGPGGGGVATGSSAASAVGSFVRRSAGGLWESAPDPSGRRFSAAPPAAPQHQQTGPGPFQRQSHGGPGPVAVGHRLDQLLGPSGFHPRMESLLPVGRWLAAAVAVAAVIYGLPWCRSCAMADFPDATASGADARSQVSYAEFVAPSSPWDGFPPSAVSSEVPQPPWASYSADIGVPMGSTWRPSEQAPHGWPKPKPDEWDIKASSAKAKVKPSRKSSAFSRQSESLSASPGVAEPLGGGLAIAVVDLAAMASDLFSSAYSVAGNWWAVGAAGANELTSVAKVLMRMLIEGVQSKLDSERSEEKLLWFLVLGGTVLIFRYLIGRCRGDHRGLAEVEDAQQSARLPSDCFSPYRAASPIIAGAAHITASPQVPSSSPVAVPGTPMPPSPSLHRVSVVPAPLTPPLLHRASVVPAPPTPPLLHRASVVPAPATPFSPKLRDSPLAAPVPGTPTRPVAEVGMCYMTRILDEDHIVQILEATRGSAVIVEVLEPRWTRHGRLTFQSRGRRMEVIAGNLRSGPFKMNGQRAPAHINEMFKPPPVAQVPVKVERVKLEKVKQEPGQLAQPPLASKLLQDKPRFLYPREVRFYADMGFDDNDRLREIITRHKGCRQSVLAELLAGM